MNEPGLKLILMRHGIAERDGESDHKRALTPLGLLESRNVAKAFLNSITPQLAIVSDSVRTQATWLAVAEQLGKSPNLCRVANDPRLYTANSHGEVADIIASNVDEAETTVLVVGHNPVISTFATHISKTYVSFNPSDCIVFHVSSDDWMLALHTPLDWKIVDTFTAANVSK